MIKDKKKKYEKCRFWLFSFNVSDVVCTSTFDGEIDAGSFYDDGYIDG